MDNTINIENWAQFCRLSQTQFAGWAFRGQADAEWTVKCTLTRRLESGKVHKSMWPYLEARSIRLFKKKAHSYLNKTPKDSDTFQWLSIMQHHGAPTRLIDFTWSPFIAAYFALESAAERCAVWAIHPARLWQQSLKVAECSAASEVDIRRPGVFEKVFLHRQSSFVFQGEPQFLNPRLAIQCGTFVIPGAIDEPLESVVWNQDSAGDLLVKIVLPREAIRREAMSDLYVMNIRAATLFPDIDGFARSIAYELEHHWAIDIRSGKIVKEFAAYPGVHDLDTRLEFD